MALGMRSKKSLNERKPFGRGKSGKFESNGDDSYRGRGDREERKSFSGEKKFARRGRDGEDQSFGRKPINGRRFESKGDDSYRGRGERDERKSFRKPFNGRRDEETGREMRGDRRKMEVRQGERMPFRSEANDRFRSSGRVVGRREGGIRDDGSEGMASGGRELRDGGGRKRDRKIPFRSAVIDELRSRGRILGWKRREARQNDSEGTMRREMRGDRRRKRDDQREEMDESGDSVEASSGKLQLKWKKMDKKQRDTGGDRCREEGNNRRGKGSTSEKSINSDNEIDEQKPVRRYTRVLDKFGKKIKVAPKHSDDSTADKIIPVRKKKRIIRIDPHDTSNKRLDDSPLTSGKT